jgi:hypothetical protein
MSYRKYDPKISSARGIWKKSYGEMLFEDFYELSQQNCFYCGDPPNNTYNIADKRYSKYAKEEGNFIYSGLDRKDNTIKKHTKENCVACCANCNLMKRDRNADEFIEWANRVYKHLNK